MTVSSMKCTLTTDVQKVWDTMTSLQNYTWRSDISKIEVISDSQFIEYSKDGFATTFNITVNEPNKRWEFDIENPNMEGHWTGLFTSINGETEVEFIEAVTVKKLIMKPFVKSYLKKQQSQYAADLKKALSAAEAD